MLQQVMSILFVVDLIPIVGTKILGKGSKK
jgi:hypothetical protein